MPAEVRAAGGPLAAGDLAWASRDAALDVAGRLATGGPLAQAYAAYVARVLAPVTGDAVALANGSGPVAAALIIEPVRPAFFTGDKRQGPHGAVGPAPHGALWWFVQAQAVVIMRWMKERMGVDG